MSLVMENTRTLASGRVIYRRVYPAKLRPFVPKQAREFKVSLGRKDAGIGARVDAAKRKYEAIIAEAKARLSGALTALTPLHATSLGEWLRAEMLSDDEEARWDQTERNLYDSVASQLDALGVDYKAGWSGRSKFRWSEKATATVSGNLEVLKRYRATGDLDAIVETWGQEATELAATKGFEVRAEDEQSLAIVCRALNDAAIRAGEDRLRRMAGEDVPTPAFPDLVPPEREVEARPTLGLLAIFDGYAAAQGISAGVRNEWRKAVERLVEFLGHDDASKLTAANLRDWRDALLLEATVKGSLRTPRTVRNKYLTPIKAALKWAVDEQRIDTNVASNVVVRVPKAAKLREKSYTNEEASRVLKAALAPSSERSSVKSALARRWVPWLCAYTGARVNEVTQLRREDVIQQDGVWLIRITPAAGRVKTNEARLVPIHEHLVEQGFLQVVEAAGTGPLFYDEARRRVGEDTESRQHKKIGERLAAWVRNEVGIVDPGIKPNHAWRDTFKTIALEAGVQERVIDAMEGHAPNTVGRTYGHASVKTMDDAMKRFPRFVV